MIEGKFGDNEELIFPIEIIAAEGLEFEIDAILDTGFSEWLAIDKQDVDELGWLYVTNQSMQTARSFDKFDIYLGKVRIDKQEFDIPVHAAIGVTDILLGRKWLRNRQLVVDMASGVLTLGENQ